VTITSLIWVVGGALSISFLCSILEAVLLSISHSYVAILRQDGDKAGEYLHALQQSIDQPIAAILTLNTIANTLGASVGGAIAAQIFPQENSAYWFGAGLTLGVLVFSEVIPKTLGASYWKNLAVPTAYVLRWLTIAMKPFVFALGLLTRMITPSRSGQETVSRAEIEILAQIGAREGTLDEEEWRVVSNVIRLDEVAVGEVMTPRTDVIAVSADSTLDEAKSVMIDEGHLRLPVYDGSLDTIQGILLARDLWLADRDGGMTLSDIVRPVAFVPTSKVVDELIGEMRAARSKMAIVVDEFGGTAGIVTLEDLIEEIVGEIRDEHEEEPEEFEDLGGGSFRIWGGVSPRVVNDRLGLSLPEDAFDTIGGYVFGELHRIPRVGDVVEVADTGRFKVVRMHGRRVDFLQFTRSGPDAHEPADP